LEQVYAVVTDLQLADITMMHSHYSRHTMHLHSSSRPIACVS